MFTWKFIYVLFNYVEIPNYLRFQNIQLNLFNELTWSNSEKFITLLNNAFNESRLEICCEISNDHLNFLNYIALRVLPRFKGIKSFHITIWDQIHDYGELLLPFINTILKKKPISNCLDVKINIYSIQQRIIPLDGMWFWLNHQKPHNTLKELNITIPSLENGSLHMLAEEIKTVFCFIV